MPDYSWLLKQLQDEAEGATPTPPPLPTTTPIVEPSPAQITDPKAPSTGQPAPIDPKLDTTPPAPPPATTPTAPPPAASPKPKTLGELYGVDLSDAMKPVTPAPNNSALIANIGRIGNTLNGALSGTKPDNKFFDTMDAEGQKNAEERTKGITDVATFKRQLYEKLANDKAAKEGKYNPALNDLKSPESKSLIAEYTATGAPGAKFIKDYIAAGGSLNALEAKPHQFVPANTAQENSIRSNEGQNYRLGLTHAQQDKLKGWDHDFAIAKTDYEQALGVAKDQREAFSPDRAFLDSKQPPTGIRVQRTAESDGAGRFVLGQIQRVRDLIRDNPNLRSTPGFNDELRSAAQTLAAATLKLRHYGVPNGKDWEMIDREIGTPTAVMDLLLNRADNQVAEVAGSVQRQMDEEAHANGYGPFKPGSGMSSNGDPMAEARKTVRRHISPPGSTPAAVPETPPEAAPAAATPSGSLTPGGKPYVKMQQKKDASGKVVATRYLDANGAVVE